MVSKLDHKIVGLSILFLLCWVGFCPLAARSAVVLSDDFNDGNYDGWTICENPVYNSGSSWSATNFYLQLVQEGWGMISYPSDTTYGTWSLDWKAIEANVNTDSFASITFISSNLDGDHWDDWWCYWLYIRASATSEGWKFAVSLRRTLDGEAIIIDTSEDLVPAGAWYHIDITRTTAGLFSVYQNGSLILQGENTDIDTSELFVIFTTDWQMFDNIVVDDAPPFDWLVIAIIGVSAVVIIAVVVIFVRRR